MKYRLRKVAPDYWTLLHPDGYWVGPGLGQFYTPDAAFNWLCTYK